MVRSRVTHNGPTTGLMPYWLGRFWMWLFRWDVVGEVPNGEKFVLIGAPHTSNWDFPFGIFTFYIFRLRVSWVGKDTLFRWPLGRVMRWLGGIPVNRESQSGAVDQIAKQLRESSKCVIAIAPSGTRKRRDHWKSGFYWIAHSAQVPILCGYLDYAQRKSCLGLCFLPTGNVKEDMDRIRGFYEGIHGKYPEVTTTMRLKDEM